MSETLGTILVVDDDPQAVEIISKLLSLKGYATLPATSGRACLEAAQTASPDVILLDVMMPELDGLQVCEQLVADERTKAIPVILLTGKDDYETRAAGMKLGVSEFLAKPVNKTELYARVEAQLRGRAMAKKIDEQLAKLPTDG